METDDRPEIIVNHKLLNKFVTDVLLEVGLTPDHASIMAEGLVTANLRGVDTHGVIRLEHYVQNLEEGGYNPSPEMKAVQLDQSTVRFDADNAPGQVAAATAMDKIIEIAKETGTAATCVVDSNHFGTGAYHVHRATQENCIAIFTTNAPSKVVPYGGTEPYFGTNPIVCSFPADREFDVTLDMATSTVAGGKVTLAKKKDEEIPPEWAIDEKGDPTTKPKEVYAMTPVGRHKGYGMGLLVELFSAVLTGMNLSPDIGSMYDYSTPQEIGHFAFVVDVESFRDLDQYYETVDELLNGLKSTPTQHEDTEIMIPGEPEHRTREARVESGIPLPQKLYWELTRLGETYDVPFPE
jgi:ureidoglycolate dehydrogenase (NAD+)